MPDKAFISLSSRLSPRNAPNAALQKRLALRVECGSPELDSCSAVAAQCLERAARLLDSWKRAIYEMTDVEEAIAQLSIKVQPSHFLRQACASLIPTTAAAYAPRHASLSASAIPISAAPPDCQRSDNCNPSEREGLVAACLFCREFCRRNKKEREWRFWDTPRKILASRIESSSPSNLASSREFKAV